MDNKAQDLIDKSSIVWDAILERPQRRYRLALKAVIQRQYPDEDSDAFLQHLSRYVSAMKGEDEDKLPFPPVFLSPYKASVDFSKDEVTLDTDIFPDLLMDFAEECGIDLKEFAQKLSPFQDVSEYQVGVALRTIFEVEGYYKEYPHAFTLYRVPKNFLIILGAAIIGIGVAETSALNPIIAGSISGVGSFLINVLASRLTEESEPKIDWLEELILKIIEAYGKQSYKDIKFRTNIYGPLLRQTITKLKKKGLIQEHRSYVDKNNTTYSFK